MWVFAVIAALPVVEIMLFMTVGVWLGLWLTLAIILGSGVLGWQIIRQEGVGSLRALQVAAAPDDPLTPLADRAMLAVAGVLLILPGFLTDTLGLFLLIPAVRRGALHWLRRHVRLQGFVAGATGQRSTHADWVDAEYEEIVPDRDKLGGGSKWTRP